MADTEEQVSKRKRGELSAEAKEAKRKSDKRRAKTRVNIGLAFQRWRDLRQEHRFTTDAQLAFFLLDHYRQHQVSSTPSKATGPPPPPPPLSSIATDSDRGRDADFAIPGVQSVGVDHDYCILQDSVQSMSLTDEEPKALDENETNALINTVIDIEDAAEDAEEFMSDSSDDEDLPPLQLRTGGALATPLQIDTLPIMGMDEVVHGVSDDLEGEDMPPFPDVERVVCEEDLINKQAAIVYYENLRTLATFLQLPIQNCPVKGCRGSPPFELTVTSRGTAVILEWHCPSGHHLWKWNSQPLLKFSMQGGDFMLATNILLSGNNYAKIKLLFKYMNMGIVASKTFFSIQDAYCVDTIKEFWLDKKAEVIDRLRNEDHIVVLGDGRMDSPGHSAQYCTYTTIEQESREIVHIVTVDKRETNKNSVIMEREGFVRTMDMLLPELSVKEVVTDAHNQISALMDPDKGKYGKQGIHHSLDIWHCAKNLCKSIQKAGAVKEQSAIKMWAKHIVNHFWYCSKQAKTAEEFKMMWKGVLNHVTDQHFWKHGSCDHEPLDDSSRDKPWIEQGSAAHLALTAIVLDKRLLNKVHKFIKFRTTSDLETFQNHLLMYAAKRYAYSPPVYEARTLLAALDYNHHLHRPAAFAHNGHPIMKRCYNKKSQRWNVIAVKVQKDYGYIPELQRAILGKRVQSGRGLPNRRPPRRESDARRYGPLPHQPPPPTEELVRTQIPRGQYLS